jgi:2-polyprenyl-6-methoxyphenol hydroxylase-like FAD-dependent oxidoreductase
VVIGGSIAGMLAATVLAEHFELVTIFDREPPATAPVPRKSVPQARHSHLLLPPGYAIMRDLLPGLFAEIEAAGPPRVDLARDMAWHHFGRWRPRFRADIMTTLCTRPLLEYHVQQRVLALPRVRVQGGCTVERLLADRQQITGVRIHRPDGSVADVAADFVVDASGRGSRLPDWLAELGFARPREDAVRIDLGYTSRLYAPPADFAGGWKFLVSYPNPPHSWRGGLICSVERGAWSVSLNGYFHDYPPTDEAGFLEFARSLTQPYIYEYLRKARPLSELRAYRLAAVRRLRYESLGGLPERLYVVGDAVCYLNPMFGQGMSLAAFGAEALRVELRARHDKLEGLGRAAQRRLGRRLAMPWFLTTSLDLRFPQAQGGRPPWLPLVHRYIDGLMQTVTTNRRVCLKLYRVLAMQSDGRALLAPAALLPVLRAVLQRPPQPDDADARSATLPRPLD